MSNSMPGWEVPFDVLGKVVLALPEEIVKVSTEASAVSTALPPFAQTVSKLLEDATIAITDKGLVITMDIQVAKDFMAAFAQLKTLADSLKGV